MQPELHARFASERLTQSGDDDPLASQVDAARGELELERRVPPGPLLLAEVEGTVEAAVGVEDGETIANPFARSGEAVPLLRLRAEQLRAAS